MNDNKNVSGIFNAYVGAVRGLSIRPRFREFLTLLQGSVPESGNVSSLMEAVAQGVYQPGEGWKDYRIQKVFMNALEKRRKKYR